MIQAFNGSDVISCVLWMVYFELARSFNTISPGNDTSIVIHFHFTDKSSLEYVLLYSPIRDIQGGSSQFGPLPGPGIISIHFSKHVLSH